MPLKVALGAVDVDGEEAAGSVVAGVVGSDEVAAALPTSRLRLVHDCHDVRLVAKVLSHSLISVKRVAEVILDS